MPLCYQAMLVSLAEQLEQWTTGSAPRNDEAADFAEGAGNTRIHDSGEAALRGVASAATQQALKALQQVRSAHIHSGPQSFVCCMRSFFGCRKTPSSSQRSRHDQGADDRSARLATTFFNFCCLQSSLRAAGQQCRQRKRGADAEFCVTRLV